MLRSQRDNESVPEKIARMMNKNVELSHYKFMLVYTYDVADKCIRNIPEASSSGKELLTYWLEVNESCIELKQ